MAARLVLNAGRLLTRASLARAIRLARVPSASLRAPVLQRARTLPRTPACAMSTDASSASAAAPQSEPEREISPGEKLEFQAETRKLLDIVAKSLYKDRKVFIRELISNAADALEKRRHVEAKTGAVSSAELKISVLFDDKANTVTIADSGIGMTRDELVANLGTIARSGTAAFVDELKSAKDPSAAASNVIGRFGVGFYSVFIVGDRVTVYSKTHEPGAKGYKWESDGAGSYTISEAANVAPGTKIIIHLNKDSHEFAGRYALEDIIKQYSNFVAFPILLEGERVNTIEPLWTKARSAVTKDEHNQFYRFIAHAYDDPAYHLHFVADVPVDVKSVLYFPRVVSDLDTSSAGASGISLYSRRVLIASKPTGLLPDWLRFVRGVVDSEDLPLNISREFTQDSSLMRNLNRIITRRIMKHLEEQLAADRNKYALWFKNFGKFIKEGVYMSDSREDLASLMLLDSSAQPDPAQPASLATKTEDDFDNPPPSTLTTLKEYVARMQPDQKQIYYTIAPSRAVAQASPYLDAFTQRKTEVIFLYEPADEFIMQRLGKFEDKRIVSIESGEIDEAYKKAAASPGEAAASQGLTDWLKGLYGASVNDVRVSQRVLSVPALIVGHDSAVVTRLRKVMMGPGMAEAAAFKVLEINTSSPIITALNAARTSQPDVASMVAHQILDNAQIAAGLVDDARPMLKRLDKIIEAALRSATAAAPASAPNNKQQ